MEVWKLCACYFNIYSRKKRKEVRNKIFQSQSADDTQAEKEFLLIRARLKTQIWSGSRFLTLLGLNQGITETVGVVTNTANRNEQRTALSHTANGQQQPGYMRRLLSVVFDPFFNSFSSEGWAEDKSNHSVRPKNCSPRSCSAISHGLGF